MNEIRCDPLSGHRVLIAEGRTERPRDYQTNHVIESESICPFCAGNESKTPEEVLRTGGTNDTNAWEVRIVRNKYPALSPPAPVDPHLDLESAGTTSLLPEDETSTVAGEGLHEVIIESPEHHVRTADLGVAQLAVVLGTTKRRLEQIQTIPNIKSAHVFKNVGPAGGATIEHSHSQLIALPFIPHSLSRELEAMARHQQKTQHCLLCDLQENEIRGGQRLIAENANFTAFCAYAGRQPGETWIVPKNHLAHFSTIALSECESLAEILHQALAQLDIALKMPAYNYMIQSAPLEGTLIGHYHWRLVILPRVTTQAGFEWGSGCFINPIAPERAAEAIRRRVPVEEIEHSQTKNTNSCVSH